MSNLGETAIGLDEAAALVVPREIREALFIAAAHAWNTGEVTFDHELARAVDAVADLLALTREEVVELMIQEWLHASEGFVSIENRPDIIFRPSHIRSAEQGMPTGAPPIDS
ncbi:MULTISPECIES: hypothetical protein [Rhizobium/Agrobacterium group]|uniref:Uncharacterized protein n=1 Tax=Rhizobium subbaraonis TaxID=908946 RepID=A0A285V5S7_9HYPH|nr:MULTISPECIES: hypothetical protein [Rhizobium/Agrobacterium group]WLS06961.1 hypothetical protein Q9314_12195 [Shinella sumterensis]MDH0871707.1 hypothetical protein [Agrobacterium pusense]TQN62511.1 hypothetical protein FLX27_05775 [Agrobacterium tumefaciens]CDN94557.1 hypothetical protein BN949_03727 [Agrobacterium tumefaciens]SOC47861.1 hypothetical protein SAMN05892877_1342 [Rhizobium subbaraonis]